MEHMQYSPSDKKRPLLVPVRESAKYLHMYKAVEISTHCLQLLIQSHLLPVFKISEQTCVVLDDLLFWSRISHRFDIDETTLSLHEDMYDRSSASSYVITLDDHTSIAFQPSGSATGFAPAIRNLLDHVSSQEALHRTDRKQMQYLHNGHLVSAVTEVREYAKLQTERAARINMSMSSEFARSAHYMGSKRNLSSFLAEAIYGIQGNDGTVVDLMCGSGAASGSFSRIWEVVASDVQRFSQKLAIVQGGGYDIARARNLLTQILPVARDHASLLTERLSPFIEYEEDLLHRDVDEALKKSLAKLARIFPLYPDSTGSRDWNPQRLVAERKSSPKSAPYCLFVTYFANVYFGIRQCVEIDSLRYAIDHIQSSWDQDWALGALVSTASAVGLTYGGHFAQPPITDYERIGDSRLASSLEKRGISVFHEFAVRLSNQASESEKSKHAVNAVGGPWRKALETIERLPLNPPITVYLDAPYKREEYSRYYHVLETLVNYSYPSSKGVGRMPDKHKGERFDSEFFTRDISKHRDSFVSIVGEVLQRGWNCAWSYADAGYVNIADVMERISASMPCTVSAYSTPYAHRSHGGRPTKRLVEYLILVRPRADETKGRHQPTR